LTIDALRQALVARSNGGSLCAVLRRARRSLETGAEATMAIDGFWLANSKRSVELR
jgi:hypothetical protein